MDLQFNYGDTVDLSAFDKVKILQRTGMFANVPEATLAKIATVVEGMGVKEGKTFIKEGAKEEDMYVIVPGKSASTRAKRRSRP